MIQRVVVTGGSGFVGGHLIAELRGAWPGADIISWDLPTVDITRPETYRDQLQELQPEWIVHLAAWSSVGDSFDNTEQVQRINVDGTKHLLEAAVSVSPATRLVVASSSDIYGTTSANRDRACLRELPLAEAVPQNPYAASKLAMEEMIEQSFADRVIRVRPFPHVGPGQRQGFVTADFASQVAAIEAGRQEPVMKVGNLEAQRDFTDVRDVVRAYRLLMERGVFGEACLTAEREQGICGVYHVASGEATVIQDLLDILLAQTTVDIAVEQDPKRMRPSDISMIVGDASKLREATGWEPTIPLEQSLGDILDWWRSQ